MVWLSSAPTASTKRLSSGPHEAIELDPKLVEAHELMANLALEDSDTRKAAAEADEAIELSPDALDAMAIHAAIELLADKPPDAWLDKIREVNPDVRRSATRSSRTISCSTAATTMASPTIARPSRSIRSCGPRARSLAST